jgi:two-component system NtrC family sensor kinase
MQKIFLTVIIFFSLACDAQSKTIDSVKKALDSYTREDTVKVVMLYGYSDSLYDSDIEQSIRLTKTGMQLANSLNRPDLAARGNLGLVRAYGRANKDDSAIFFALEGLNLAEKLHLARLIPLFYDQLGENYRLLQNYEQALYYDNKFLDIAESKKDDQMILFGLLKIIPLYAENGDWNKSRKLLERAMPLAGAQKGQYTLGRLFWNMGRISSNEHDLPKALNNYHAALEIWKKLKEYHNVDYSLVLLSSVFDHMNNKDSAGWYAFAALDTAKKYKLNKEMGDAHGVLFAYYYHNKDYKNALEERLILDSIDYLDENAHAEQTALKAQIKYEQEKKDLLAQVSQANKDAAERRTRNLQYGIISVFILLAAFLFYNNRQKQLAKTRIEKAYGELKTTQAQLIQSEKMASLGELTAGIAHEIQNPLNFMNNFSEVNKELLAEMKDELGKGNIQVAGALADDVARNEEKINHHGRRADAIVKGMLQHSRSSSGKKEPNDINLLADEYLRLSYHGLRAKDNSFNASMKTDFETGIGKVNIVPQDIGRVLLNIYNNAFYAVNEKKKTADAGYEPIVSVSTETAGDQVEIKISDNGNGIPQQIIDKIFQPFFTTKPTGQGTGLGLSLSYDIVKAHGGEIKVTTAQGKGTVFTIQLPSKLI